MARYKLYLTDWLIDWKYDNILSLSIQYADRWRMDGHTDGRTELLYQYPGCCHLANSRTCHPRATCHIAGWKNIPSAVLKIVFRRILFIYCFLNAVWASASGGFRIVSDTLVCFAIHNTAPIGSLDGMLSYYHYRWLVCPSVQYVSPITDAHLRTRWSTEMW